MLTILTWFLFCKESHFQMIVPTAPCCSVLLCQQHKCFSLSCLTGITPHILGHVRPCTVDTNRAFKMRGSSNLFVCKTAYFFDAPDVKTKVFLCWCREGINEERPHIEQSLFILLPTHPNVPLMQRARLTDRTRDRELLCASVGLHCPGNERLRCGKGWNGFDPV